MSRTVRSLALAALLAIAACGGDDAGEGSRPSTSTTARPQPRATTTTTVSTTAGTSSDVAPARFASAVAEVTAIELGATWREGCPVPPEGLRRVTVSHWGMDGAVHEGQLVVAVDLVDQIVAVFDDLFTARYPVQRMEPISAFGGDDQASMAANNTSAFNCRTVA
ncbi:MAG: M15 family peptidase, partial [Actinomycetota bacterium]|nr:M15 family peptidase [Actinomycetota bacterium]